MRKLGLILALALALAGCAGGPPTDRPRPFKPPERIKGAARQTRPKAAPPAASAAPATPATELSPSRYPRIRPVVVLAGRVVAVNAKLRFVVLDFALNPLPPIDQRLDVFRDGRKVGELKVTGPAQGTNTVADIVAGEAQAGDEVREP